MCGSDPSVNNQQGEALEDLLQDWDARYGCHGDEDGVRTGASVLDVVTGPSRTEILEITDLGISTGMLMRLFRPEGDEGRELLSGTILGGKWQILRKLSEGTFGSFYLGKHKVLGMKVGIKVLKRCFTANEANRDAFWKESMRLGRLVHPNIVQVHDYGEENGSPFLVMELLSGRSLLEHMRAGDLSLEDCVEVMYQVSLALTAAHSGVETDGPLIHLDLKPEHLFLQRDRNRLHVKVIDFGIAEIVCPKMQEDADSAGKEGSPMRFAGTLEYMAPERWKGIVHPQCDVYSLGVILYEIIAGRRPFTAPNSDDRDGQYQQALQHLHETMIPDPPSSHRMEGRSAAVKELDSIALRCLEKDPRDRPQTAASLAEELQTWQTRPRLTARQKIARRVGIPLLVAVILIGLFLLARFLWGPEYSVHPVQELKEAGVVVGTSQSSCDLEASVTPRGRYDEGKVLLHVQIENDPGIVELEGAVEDGLISAGLTLAHVEAAVGRTFEKGKEESYTAALRVECPPWRSIESEPFQLKVDLKGPHVSALTGDVKQAVGKQNTLWISGPVLSVTSVELLNLKECYVRWDSEELRPEQVQGHQATFRFPAKTRPARIVLKLQSVYGNSAEFPWDLRWYDVPRLVGPGSIVRTNVREPEIELRVEGDSPKIEVRIDGKKPEGDPTTTRYKLPISFDAGVQRDKKLVQVKLWSPRSLEENLAPEVDTIIHIEFQRRELEIKIPESLDELEAFPQTLSVKVIDKQTEVFLDSELNELSWNGTLDLTTGSNEVKLETDMKDGRLNVNDDLMELSGKLSLRVEVTDPFGNTDTVKKPFAHRLSSPVVTIECARPGTVGSAERPLLPKACLLREKLESRGEESGSLSLHIKSAYEYSSSLQVNFNDPQRTQSSITESFDIGVNKTEIKEEELLKKLKPGPNRIYVVVADTTFPDVSTTKTCDVYCAEPVLNVSVTPDSGSLPAAEVEVRVVIDGGNVKAVRIGEQPATKQSRNEYSFRVPLEASGFTDVPIEITFVGGYRWDERREFSRKARHGWRYRFGDLTLEFYEDRVHGGSFWFVPVEDHLDLYRRFRQSTAGRKFYLRGETKKNLVPPTGENQGPSLCEAREIARWLTGRLPAFEELREILKQQPRRKSQEGMEWISDVPGELPPDVEYAFAVKKADGGLVARGANQWGGDRFPFRVIIPAGDKNNQLTPAKATHAWPPGEGGSGKP